MSVNDEYEEFEDADIIDLPSAEADDEVEMEPLFRLDGTVYQIPARPSAGMAFDYLEKQTTEGPDAAVYWMMVRMLGKEVYEKLRDHPNLPREQFDAILNRVENKVLGASPKKGKNRGGRGGTRHPGSKKPRGSSRTKRN